MSDSTQHITPEAVPSYVREERLRQIRREAEQVEKATGVREKLQRTAVPRASVETGYYGVPLLKPAPWSPDIPLYFFTGGAAGAAAIIGSVASFTGADPRLARDARYIAAIGGAISPALLIHDLGMPSRFLNMLRVFKVQSPMSVGSWTLFAFSGSSAAAAFLCAARERIRLRTSLRIIEKASQFLSLLTGAVLSTYTGVLISATAIPVWNQNTGILPVHFATSGLSAAGALLELCGHTAPALNTIGIASALGETAIGASLELRKDPPCSR